MKFIAQICILCFLCAFAVSNNAYASDSLTINGSAEMILESTSGITVTGSITGTGTLACTGPAEVYVSGDWGIANFTPGNSIVYFDDATGIISLSSNHTFDNLVINGIAGITDTSTIGLAINSTLTVSQYAILNLGNGFSHTLPVNGTNIAGTFEMGLSDLMCSGDLTVAGTGVMNMDGNSPALRPRITMADGKLLKVDGQLNTNWSVGNLKPVITSTATGARYGFQVNGRISAHGLIIASADANGLTINSGADRTCDLDNVDFQDVAPGGRHLYIGYTSGSYLGNYDNCSFDSSFAGGNNVVCAATIRMNRKAPTPRLSGSLPIP
jgi:hypothetical protein